jgi:hypothetical protein
MFGMGNVENYFKHFDALMFLSKTEKVSYQNNTANSRFSQLFLW